MGPQMGGHALGDVPSRLQVSEVRGEHRTVVVAIGEIDVATVAPLREALQAALVSTATEVWADLTQVSFMDSSGLRTFMDAHAAMSARCRRFGVICPPGSVRRVFEVAGVDSAIEVRPDLAAG